jgi:hypothetical protein
MRLAITAAPDLIIHKQRIKSAVCNKNVQSATMRLAVNRDKVTLELREGVQNLYRVGGIADVTPPTRESS